MLTAQASGVGSGTVDAYVVTVALDADSRLPQLLAQLGLLAIHVVTDPAAGDGADAGRLEHALLAPLAALVLVAHVGQHRADAGADGGALGGVRGLLFAGVGVEGFAAGQQHEAGGQDQDGGAFHGGPWVESNGGDYRHLS